MSTEIQTEIEKNIFKVTQVIEQYYRKRGNIVRNNLLLNKMYFDSELENIDNIILDLIQIKHKLYYFNYKQQKSDNTEMFDNNQIFDKLQFYTDHINTYESKLH